jgi:hypothetical protein
VIRWEYQAPFIFGGFDDLLAEIGKLGLEGWELVQLEAPVSSGSRVFLKRMVRSWPGAINRVG